MNESPHSLNQFNEALRKHFMSDLYNLAHLGRQLALLVPDGYIRLLMSYVMRSAFSLFDSLLKQTDDALVKREDIIREESKD